ncbi:hypothetical protein [Myroides fluvii]|uniref:hypothetical protein n=1 Tax=Myroides fluvii TaxID=2572594 RepID=UPI00131C5FC5|nr:hypothetical protein [Myroides fluvii]
MQINIQALKDLIETSKTEREVLGRIINPIIEKFNLPQKEILEVCQIGKFVYKIDCEINIVDKPKPPRPDFIIEYDSKLVGLEHTRIFSENADNYNRTKSIIEYSEKVYRKIFPEDKVHATISIIDDNIEYKQSEKKSIAIEIAKYVNCVKNQIAVEKPTFIENVRTRIHSQIDFTYKEKKWEAGYLTKERLEEAIRKKETRLEIYKKGETEILEYWLVLLIGSLSSASYELKENENYEMLSEFDRVYLMTDFDAEIIRIA